jgi:glyoxylase-like metal-dependent hydrolase (beta-lactamase superfamily II)
MHIHHLNCGTHCPLGGAFYDGNSRGLEADICTHCLLIETDRGLVLVDTGYGLEDVRAHNRRLARLWPLVLRPRLEESETAVRQVEALGFGAADVRHIVLTHLDFDHAGGIADFPEARVHVMAREHKAAERTPRSFVGGQRYRAAMWRDVQDWRLYETEGERWLGFEAVRALDGLPPEILMVPLAGHTLGHAGIAIETQGGWLLNAGDAYLHRGQLDLHRRHMPPGLAVYDWIMGTDREAGRANLAQLRDLKRNRRDVRIFCSHDTAELATLQGRPPKYDMPRNVALLNG